ncbi:MAG: hypothetical protein H3C34_27950, partial [Caldilineaceae bacterium]|nr:hypothetical protein [Caldilineaceae bacterium]
MSTPAPAPAPTPTPTGATTSGQPQANGAGETVPTTTETNGGEAAAGAANGAQAPAPTPLDGTISAADLEGMVEWAAYKALRECAAVIGQQVRDACGCADDSGAGNTILIVDMPGEIASDFVRGQLSDQIASFDQALTDQITALKVLAQPPASAPAWAAAAAQAAAAPATPGALALLSSVSALLAGAASPLTAASTLVVTAAGIAQFFRSNYSLQGYKVQLSSEGLRAAVAGALRSKCHVRVLGYQCIADAGLVKRYAQMAGRRVELQQQVDAVAERVQQLTAERTYLEKWRDALMALLWSGTAPAQGGQAEGKDPEQKPPENPPQPAAQEQPAPAPALPSREEVAAELQRVSDRLAAIQADHLAVALPLKQAQALLAAVDGFVTAVTTPPANETLPPLVSAALREYICSQESGTHLLYVGLNAAGGQLVTKRSFWFWQNTIAYVGYAVTSYTLVEKATNDVLAADTVGRMASLKHEPDTML